MRLQNEFPQTVVLIWINWDGGTGTDFASENVQRKTHFVIPLWVGRFTHVPGIGIKINCHLKDKSGLVLIDLKVKCGLFNGTVNINMA